MSYRVKGDDQSAPAGESFLQRFHRRKTEARQRVPEPAEPRPITLPDSGSETIADQDSPPPVRPALTDADMPPLESLGADSDYTGFLSDQVSETLRKAALRKLFHSATFNVTDGLDEYADDFTKFETLGDIITADMRHMFEVEARKKAEQARQAALAVEPDVEVDAAESPAPLQSTGEDDAEPHARQLTSENPPSGQHMALTDPTPSRTTES